MSRDKISVIVPVYKVEKKLERCIESIRKQTYENLEIILVDDGSPDRCGDICEEHANKDKRIHVIHKCNGGLSDARNVGIEYASGKYLCFVDSDDWLDRDMIELLYRVCIKRQADIVECSYRNIYSDCIKEETKCTAEIIEGDSTFALEGMLDWKYFKPVAWNKLYKRDVIGDIRYPVGKIHEDEFTTYKYFYNASKLVYVDVSKYNYDRTRTDSITGNGFSESSLDACWAFRERVDFLREHNIDTLERKMNDVYCWYVIESLYRCYQNGITGSKVDAVLHQVKKDVDYFASHSVSTQCLESLKLISEGLEEYGKKRDTIEK